MLVDIYPAWAILVFSCTISSAKVDLSSISSSLVLICSTVEIFGPVWSAEVVICFAMEIICSVLVLFSSSEGFGTS